MKILTWPNQILTTIAIDVEKIDEETNKIIDEMLNIMLSNNALGLAAPQIGISKRIIVAKISEEQLVILVNPKIKNKKDLGLYEEEGCLSLPGVKIKVERANTIDVEGLDRKGNELHYHLSNLDAIIIQHEVDHLNGITLLQKANFMQHQKIKKQLKQEARYVKRNKKKIIHKS
jgi:peptide deformylase